MSTNGNSTGPAINLLSACINKVVSDGYKECFKLTARGLYSTSRSRYYRPEQIQVITTHRFDRQANADENTLVYVLETSDGLKGMLIDAFGTHADGSIERFMDEVTDISNKMNGQGRHFC